MAEQARIQEAGGDAVLKASDLVFPPIVSPTLLMVAVVLSVFKPLGLEIRPSRTRRTPGAP
jgi:hypothetical protein